MRKLFILLEIVIVTAGGAYAQGRPGGGGRGGGGRGSQPGGRERQPVVEEEDTADYPDIEVPSSDFSTVHVYAYDFTDDGRTNWIYELVYGSKTYYTFEYDDQARLIEKKWYSSFSGDKATTYSYTYDETGNLISETETYPNGGSSLTTTYTYDAKGNMSSKTSSYGYVTTYQYDANNNLIYENWGDDSFYEAAYDDNSNLSYEKYKWSNSSIEWDTYSYNSAGQITYITNYEILDEYDFMTYSKYYYNTDGTLWKIHFIDPDYYYSITYYEYDDNGRLISLNFDDGWGDDYYDEWTYNADGTTNTYSTTAYDFTTTKTYQYDELKRLIKTTDSDDYEGAFYVETFEYDEYGNVNKKIIETTY